MSSISSISAQAASETMSAPFSYAQAVSKAPSIPEPAVGNTPPKDSTISTRDSTTSGTSSRAQSVHADSAEVPKVNMDAQQKAEAPHPKNESSAPVQPKKTSNAVDEPRGADSRPRSAAQNPSTPSSIRSSSAEKSTDTRKGRKNKNSKDGCKEDNDNEDAVERKPTPPVVLAPAPLPTVNPWYKKSVVSTSDKVSNANSVPEAIAAKPVPKGGETLQTRTASRGSRGSDKEEKKVSAPVLPDDPRSWPTLPEGEEPKSSKPQSAKTQSAETPVAPAKQKKKWDKMELDHNVYPNPIPTRGRGGRGGNRGGRDAGGGRGASSAANGSGPNATGSASKESKPRAREGSSGRNGGRLNNSPGGSRRVPTNEAGPRKQSVASVKDTAEIPSTNKNQQPPAKTDASESQRPGKHQNSSREAGQASKEYPTNGREHTNGRSERGRGGYRGRGNHSGANHGHSHSHSHSQQNFAAAGAPSSFNSNPARQGNFSATGNPPQFGSGHGRGGGRGSGRGHFSRNGGSSNGGAPSAVNGAQPQRVMPIVTDVPQAFGFTNQPPFSAPPVPTGPSLPPQGIHIILVRQVDYWFSDNNLVKDTWLRKNMDGQGFVPLEVIAGFSRVKTMKATEEDIRYAVAASQSVDLWCGADGQERLRRRHNPTVWVFPYAERLPSGQQECVDPFLVHQDYTSPPAHQQWYPPAPNTATPGYYPAPYQQPDMDSAYARHFNPHVQYPIMNGMGHQPGYHHAKQLAADAPEFAPMDGAAPNGTNGAWASQNGGFDAQAPNGASHNPTEEGAGPA